MIKDVAKNLILLIFILLIQSTLFQFIRIKGVSPDFLLIFLVFISLYQGSIKGQLSGFIIGICADLISVSPLGYHAFLLTIIAFLAGQLHGKFSMDKIIFPMLLSFLAILIKRFLSLILISIFSLNYSGANLFSLSSLVEIIYNMFLAPGVFFLFMSLKPWWGLPDNYE